MASTRLSPNDPSSFSRPEQITVTSIDLVLSIDFQKHILHGHVDLKLKKIDCAASQVILDSKDLTISKVIDPATDQELSFELSTPLEEFGSKLSITLPNDNTISVIRVIYSTSPNASGLQWLTAEQTAGKQHPYLFSQFQAIHARSVLPCQDTPAVKTTYSASITAPSDLTVLMSAIRADKTAGATPSQTVTKFEQRVPMPSYLIAIACGALESRKLGPRSHVWAEKEIIEECAYEFANTEHQLATAEAICGSYKWGIYDLLVLPPSFAFGGMENPCLTFVTPTLLAGDRSLANVVAHEIAHSWTGNLVTNKNFEHFWLNEGFTVFVERKILGRLVSSEAQDFDAYCHLYSLQEEIKRLDAPLTSLVIDLSNIHPDDAFSCVPYEKGQTFLRYLETTVGGSKVFEPFLREYFENFQFKSIETEDFKKYFETYFAQEPAIKKIDWNTWLYGTGMPPVIPEYNKVLAQSVDTIVKNITSWKEGSPFPFTKADAANLLPGQKIYMFQELLKFNKLPICTLENIDQVFELSNVKNSEIKFLWFRIGIKARWEVIVKPVLTWINEVGRMKFARPLYRDLFDWEEFKAKTVANFKENRKFMMHVTAYTLAKDLAVNTD